MAELAGRQHGVVSIAQLHALGLRDGAIESRIRLGRLHRVHRGVYAVGHARLTQEARWMAAVLACGLGATLSHRSAAALWGLHSARGTRIEVTTPTRRSAAGIFVRRSVLPPDETTVHDGVPVTAPSRTLMDLGIFLTDQQLERVLREAERLRLTGALPLAELLARYPRRRGTAALHRMTRLADVFAGVTRSELEERFRLFLGRSGLSAPEWNARVELDGQTLEVDCLWREQRLIVELDGFAFHADRESFERDRLRDLRLRAAGWSPVRVTWRAIEAEPDLARQLGAVLASPRVAA